MVITATVLLIVQPLLLTVLNVEATRHRLSLHLIFHLPIILQNFILLCCCGGVTVIDPQFVIFIIIVYLFVCAYVFAVIVLHVVQPHVPHAHVLLFLMQFLNFVNYFIRHVLLV